MGKDTVIKKKTKKKTNIWEGDFANLIVFNDDYNTFDWVIECFMKICGLEAEEAIERTFFIHNFGSGIVKKGDFEELSQMKAELVNCGLNAIVTKTELN